MVDIRLGDEATLTNLYSYPNDPGNPGTLAETIQHYLQQTLQRDGVSGATVQVQGGSGGYTASINGPSPDVEQYAVTVPQFLANGQKAYAAFLKAQQAGHWPAVPAPAQPEWQVQNAGSWQTGWRMFLPLGLAMLHQRSVQLLHFPPDYTLKDMDYLSSETSDYYEMLLRANGVADGDLTL